MWTGRGDNSTACRGLGLFPVLTQCNQADFMVAGITLGPHFPSFSPFADLNALIQCRVAARPVVCRHRSRLPAKFKTHRDWKLIRNHPFIREQAIAKAEANANFTSKPSSKTRHSDASQFSESISRFTERTCSLLTHRKKALVLQDLFRSQMIRRTPKAPRTPIARRTQRVQKAPTWRPTHDRHKSVPRELSLLTVRDSIASSARGLRAFSPARNVRSGTFLVCTSSRS